jgi:hypothetical protein
MTQKAFTPEQVEHNQVVVGLSEEQKADFVEYVYHTRWIEIKETLNNWLKTQTFAHDERYPNTAPLKREPLVDSVIDNYLEHYEGNKLAFWDGVLWAEEQHGITGE